MILASFCHDGSNIFTLNDLFLIIFLNCFLLR